MIPKSGPERLIRVEADVNSVIPNRMAAQIDGDFVVFLIGMRINKPWKIGAWWPVFTAMPRMLRELERAGPESGFLGHSGVSMKMIVQYWRTFEQLEAYARDPDREHWPAWTAFNRRARQSRDDVGIWHETDLVPAGSYEAVYSGMPPTGLGRVGTLVPATGLRETARQRSGRAA